MGKELKCLPCGELVGEGGRGLHKSILELKEGNSFCGQRWQKEEAETIFFSICLFVCLAVCLFVYSGHLFVSDYSNKLGFKSGSAIQLFFLSFF
jgi:hypothetical protein